MEAAPFAYIFACRCIYALNIHINGERLCLRPKSKYKYKNFLVFFQKTYCIIIHKGVYSIMSSKEEMNMQM